MLSQAVEDYLKTIYKIEAAEGSASTSEIARRMEVAPASATAMIKRLSDMGLVKHKSYRGATLTEAGNKIALEIIRHHRLLETYLREVMGYPWEKMHEEAEHLEHHISEDFEDKIDQILGFPTHDPHGDPIPDRDGVMVEHETELLSESQSGQTLVIRRFSSRDANVLHELEDAGFVLHKPVTILERNPDSLVLSVDNSTMSLSMSLAANVYVSAE